MNRSRAFGIIGAFCIVLFCNVHAVGQQSATKTQSEQDGTPLAAAHRSRESHDDAFDGDPLDPGVPRELTRMKGRFNLGRLHPPTQQVKRSLREHLATQPDADTAWTLATIIRNGLVNTDLEFDAPSDSVRSDWHREDPTESYSTLSAVLETGFGQAPPNSEQAQKFGLSLARLRLLQGDWAGMNAVLEKLGQTPIPDSRRSALPAPPPDWTNLHNAWQPADDSMRAGNCAIEFQFEKDGRGLAGAHVLVKQPRDPRLAGYSGIRVDTLLHATQPLDDRTGRPLYDAFGYHGNDRSMTRYGVSDDTGKVSIEGLPKIPIVIEVLIPTSNFPEPGKSWDLVMEVALGDLRPTWWGGPSSVRGKEGPANVVLKENETIHYPKLIVRPQLLLNVAEWARVDDDDCVLEWQSIAGTAVPVDHYEVELMLTAPNQIPHLMARQRVIRSTTEFVKDTRWAVGNNGVGGQRLRPGNIYMFEVRAVDRDGQVIARLPRTPVWVAWSNRESSPPVHGHGFINAVPIHDRAWWQSTTVRRGGPRVELREAVTKYLAARADHFEYEYVLLGQAWLNCLDGAIDVGRPVLERLAQELPEGNVVRATARMLLQNLDSGKPLPKRLEFTAE